MMVRGFEWGARNGTYLLRIILKEPTENIPEVKINNLRLIS